MDAFIGEIRLLPYSFAPQDWAFCGGQEIAVQQNNVLYAVIGNAYGGTAGQTFKLPNMQGTVPIGMGDGPGLTSRNLGPNAVGDNSVTITANQLAGHTHTVTTKLIAGPAGTAVASLTDKPAADSWLSRAVLVGSSGTVGPITNFTSSSTPDSSFPAQTINPSGGAPSGTAVAAHENRQPFMPINFCMCVNGTYPMRP